MSYQGRQLRRQASGSPARNQSPNRSQTIGSRRVPPATNFQANNGSSLYGRQNTNSYNLPKDDDIFVGNQNQDYSKTFDQERKASLSPTRQQSPIRRPNNNQVNDQYQQSSYQPEQINSFINNMIPGNTQIEKDLNGQRMMAKYRMERGAKDGWTDTLFLLWDGLRSWQFHDYKLDYFENEAKGLRRPNVNWCARCGSLQWICYYIVLAFITLFLIFSQGVNKWGKIKNQEIQYLGQSKITYNDSNLAVPLQIVLWHRSGNIINKCREFQRNNRNNAGVNQHKDREEIPDKWSNFDQNDKNYFGEWTCNQTRIFFQKNRKFKATLNNQDRSWDEISEFNMDCKLMNFQLDRQDSDNYEFYLGVRYSMKNGTQGSFYNTLNGNRDEKAIRYDSPPAQNISKIELNKDPWESYKLVVQHEKDNLYDVYTKIEIYQNAVEESRPKLFKDWNFNDTKMYRGDIGSLKAQNDQYDTSIIGEEAFINAGNTTRIVETNEYKINWQKPGWMSANILPWEWSDVSYQRTFSFYDDWYEVANMALNGMSWSQVKQLKQNQRPDNQGLNGNRDWSNTRYSIDMILDFNQLTFISHPYRTVDILEALGGIFFSLYLFFTYFIAPFVLLLFFRSVAELAIFYNRRIRYYEKATLCIKIIGQHQMLKDDVFGQKSGDRAEDEMMRDMAMEMMNFDTQKIKQYIVQSKAENGDFEHFSHLQQEIIQEMGVRPLDYEQKVNVARSIDQLSKHILMFSLKRNGPFVQMMSNQNDPFSTELNPLNQSSKINLTGTVEWDAQAPDDINELNQLDRDIQRNRFNGVGPNVRSYLGRGLFFRDIQARDISNALPDDLLKVKDQQRNALYANEQALFNLYCQDDKSLTQICYQLKHRVSFFGIYQVFEQISTMNKRLQRLENLEDENTMLKLRIESLLKNNITRTMQASLGRGQN